MDPAMMSPENPIISDCLTTAAACTPPKTAIDLRAQQSLETVHVFF